MSNPHPYIIAQQNMQIKNPEVPNMPVQQQQVPPPFVQQASSSYPQMVQVPVFPQQQQMYPSLQSGTTLYSSGAVMSGMPPSQNNNQPLPPVQFVSSQTTALPNTTQQYITTTTTTATVDNVAHASTEDQSLRVVGRSVGSVMWSKLKARVTSPTALIGSLCNLLSVTLVFLLITIISQSTTYPYVPAHLHIVFWIGLPIQVVTMILKSPALMVVSLLLNLTCCIMSIVRAASYGSVGFGIAITLFVFACIFCIRLGFRYVIRVNANKQAQIDMENGQQVSADTNQTLQSQNPVLAMIESLKRNQRFVMEFKFVDLLIGA